MKDLSDVDNSGSNTDLSSCSESNSVCLYEDTTWPSITSALSKVEGHLNPLVVNSINRSLKGVGSNCRKGDSSVIGTVLTGISLSYVAGKGWIKVKSLRSLRD